MIREKSANRLVVDRRKFVKTLIGASVLPAVSGAASDTAVEFKTPFYQIALSRHQLAFRHFCVDSLGTANVGHKLLLPEPSETGISYHMTRSGQSVAYREKGVESNALYDGFRRNYLNIFQINPRLRVLANNSSSDPCAFTLYMYAEMAARGPSLAPGLSCLDLVRWSLERYLAAMKGYGEVGYSDAWEGTDRPAWLWTLCSKRCRWSAIPRFSMACRGICFPYGRTIISRRSAAGDIRRAPTGPIHSRFMRMAA